MMSHISHNEVQPMVFNPTGASSCSSFLNGSMNACHEDETHTQYGFQEDCTTNDFLYANKNMITFAKTSKENDLPICNSKEIRSSLAYEKPSSTMQTFLNGNNHIESYTNQNTTKNVHFSPVVSQLRYPPASLQNLPQSQCLDSSSKSPQKVTVCVQRIEKPMQQHVQRVQVCIPQHQSQIGQKKILSDLNDSSILNQSVRDKDKNNELFKSLLCQGDLEQKLERSSKWHILNKDSEETSSKQWSSFSTANDTLAKCETERNPKSLNMSPLKMLHNRQPSATLNIEQRNDICTMSVPSKKTYEFPENLQKSDLLEDPTSRFENNFPVAISRVTGNYLEGANADHIVCNTRQKINLGSLESLSVDEPDDNCGNNLNLQESGCESGKKSKGESKGHSWPNAYRKLKEKSKPKLSFLHRITFGRFASNGGKSPKEEKENFKTSKSKKSQKRSSCPPLGHPLLLNSALSTRDRESCSGIEDFQLHYFRENPLKSTDSEIVTVEANVPTQGLPGSHFRDEIRSKVGENSHTNLQKEWKEADIIDTNSEKGISALLESASVSSINGELPPRPSRQRKSSQASNSSGYSSIHKRLAQLSQTNEPADPDELSLTFERIMEGIWDLDSETSNRSPKDKAISDGHTYVLGEDEKANIYHSDANAIDEEKPSHAVIGKPPIPPFSARLSGMRTGAHERLSYLKGRISATATTETRLAMELAAKLSEFREELHKSREEIANSRPNLDEIENSVRISMAIDRAQRTLPQSRNSTMVSLPPMPPLLLYGKDSSYSVPAFTTFPTCTSGTSSQERDQPVKPVTEIINEEWESVVLRAKKNFSRPSHYPHYYSNNGKSADPLRSRGIVLETDLDSGTSLGYPAENNFNHGDGVRHQDLGKALKVEDPATTTGPSSLVQRNSCSLQNISSCGVTFASKMATLTPGDPGGANGKEDRSRSMEFLIDDDKNAHLRPPENTLMKNQDSRRVSEHELRVQRSLQKLNVPDWYKNYAPSGTASAAGTPSKSREFGSGTGLAGGWPGLSTSKTSSLTSLQSAGRYAGSKSGFSYGRHRPTGTASAGGRSSRDSLMSPSSTASASPSPNFERSSFTYGMPYALTRFATTRMSCGASPASLSPSPSPVGGIGTSTSTPVSSGPSARYGYQKQPYLGWRSQERLASKSLYRSPAERLAADLIAQKVKPVPVTPIVVEQPPPPEIEVKTSPKKETASSDLSLNNSEESNSHKLNRVRSSIKEVSNAIVDYVNESKPLDDGMNGRASPRRGFVWLESSFVGTKPIDSPGTPDTPSTFMSQRGSRKDTAFRFDESSTAASKDGEAKSGESSSTSHYASYISRNEQMEERSNSSSVSSPTLEDILDSLLALRRPNKKFRSRGKGHESTPKAGTAGGDEVDFQYSPSTTTTTTSALKDEPRTSAHSPRQPVSSYHQYDYEPSTTSEIYSTAITSSTKNRHQEQTPLTPSSDWQDRLNQPLADSTFTYREPETFTLTGTSRKSGATSGAAITSSNSSSNNNYSSYDKTQVERYSSSVSASGTTGVGLNESVTCSSSSSANVIHSASSSIHSTPTHQQYQYKQQQHNQSSSSMASSSAVAATVKDYYCSSTSSSPAKSCLVDSSQHHRDDNELRQSILCGGGDDDEELAFGNPTEIRSTTVTSSGTVAPITGGVIINPLTGLSEYSNPPTPARHRRVSFDLDFSDKEEKSSSRSRNKDENVGGTIQCRNTKCGKTATGLEARREFKVCHNCNAYYCSRECRRAHWEKHKKTCMQSRVGAICKQIISHVKEDSYVMNQLSTVAKRGFLAKGRGCVKLFFNSADRAERFLTGGLPELPEPLYIPHSDMLPEEMGAQTFSELSDQCRSYNPETRFVLYACVCVVNEVPTYGAVKWERELISRSSKLRLLLPRNFYEESQRLHHHLLHHPPANPTHLMSALQDPSSGRTSPATPGLQAQQPHVPLYDSVTPSVPSSDDFPPPPPPHQNTVTTAPSSENDTLILRSVPPPSSHQLNSNEHKRLREVSFTNIQKHLLLRGVDLKRSYPDIFMKLCKYVEHDEPFLPVTIYPRNNETGRQFVCVIMPESSDSAYSAATEESVQRHPLQRVETINISEQDDDEFMDLT